MKKSIIKQRVIELLKHFEHRVQESYDFYNSLLNENQSGNYFTYKINNSYLIIGSDIRIFINSNIEKNIFLTLYKKHLCPNCNSIEEWYQNEKDWDTLTESDKKEISINYPEDLEELGNYLIEANGYYSHNSPLKAVSIIEHIQIKWKRHTQYKVFALEVLIQANLNASIKWNDYTYEKEAIKHLLSLKKINQDNEIFKEFEYLIN